MRLDLGLCVVRSWASADLAPLVRNANDPRVSEHLRDRFPSPYSVGDGRRFLARLRRALESTVWAVEVDGEAVAGLAGQHELGVAEIQAERSLELPGPAHGLDGQRKVGRKGTSSPGEERAGLQRFELKTASGAIGRIHDNIRERSGWVRLRGR